MQAPFDVKDLVERFKSAGLDVAEESAKSAYLAVTAWAKDSVKLSATPFDDVALVVLPKLDEIVLKAIDGLDGKVG